MTFLLCVHFLTTSLIKIGNIFHVPEATLSILISPYVALPVLELDVNGIKQYVHFCVQLLPFNIICMTISHVILFVPPPFVYLLFVYLSV